MNIVELDSPSPAAIRRVVAAKILEQLAELEATSTELAALQTKVDRADFTVVDLYRIAQLLGSSMADLIAVERTQ
ncbi:hypothetical protein [Mycolicibacterium porcinum]|uniref:Antitoxin n=1 Tax=Mycolicibacterium porcinum TaxID=39693 RepID=A0ABV3VDY8_9MYCO